MRQNQLIFDENGHLHPYEVIATDIATLKTYFVDAFPNSTTRSQLYDNYLRYIYRFQDEIFPFFEQWINGSFVTQKENPKDIDFVIFLDYQVYEKREEKVLDKFWTFSLEKEGLDAYLVKEYPNNHQLYEKYLTIRRTWDKRYSNTKPVNNLVFPKGFLKINFEKSQI